MNEYKGQEYKSFVGEKGLSIVLYYATWCGPCKMLKPVLEKIDKELNEVNFGRIDIDEYREQAKEVLIKSVPTVLLYKDGKEVDRKMGYQPKEKLLGWINNLNK